MSVLIVGGHERMEREYMNICKKHGCKAKVFCKYESGMAERIGKPDLMVLFTHEVSHKMVKCALDNMQEGTEVVRSHSSSQAALRDILKSYAR